MRIGGSEQLTAFFRESGRYLIKPSLVVTTNKAIDDKTGAVSKMEYAWTGTIHAEPFAIELPALVDKGSGDGVITGTVLSADAKPVVD